MINFKKTFGLAVALGVFFSIGCDSLASENTTDNYNQSLFEILTASQGDKSEARPVKKDEKKDEPIDFENDPAYKDEFKARFDLYKAIKEVFSPDHDLSEYISILNTKAAKLEDIKKANFNLAASSFYNPQMEDIKDEEIKNDVKDYLLYGKLFFDDLIDKTDVNGLHAFYEASINSYAYKNAEGEKKKSYDEIFKKIYDFIVKADEKGGELSDEDKAQSEKLYKDLAGIIEKKDESLKVKESMTIRNNPYLSNANQVNADDNIDMNSPFYKSDATRDAYKALANNDFRKKIDSLNTDNNDFISASELGADGELDANNPPDWIKPFLEEEVKKKQVSVSSQPNGQTPPQTENVGGTTQQTSQTPSTATNPAPAPPETVTISSGNAAEKSNEDKKDKDPDSKTVTYASNQVKTGIKSISFVGIILVAALVIYFILGKANKKQK
uniref:hypothetical protein n=1 Tax=Anaerococcus mediterraneensis TaxID=1870984 RepID=UPI000931EF85|nr:hypothetical protein [Anaerococcus mediterraneensis]